MKITCIIVEDEPLAMERITGYVQKIPWLQLLATFDNGIDALLYLKNQQPDLVLLDIHLGELSGIRMLETSAIPGQVILTTAYHEFAVKAFDLHVTDYLLKPFTFERFMQAIEKVRSSLSKMTDARDFIFVKTEYRLEKVPLTELLFIQGMRDYRQIHTTTQRIMTLQTFGEFEQQIPSSIVCRIHKSFMVTIARIESIERNSVKIGGQVLPVSETYRKSFFELISKG